jgi:alpha-tubulin suppressor-like RCC1 family protein
LGAEHGIAVDDSGIVWTWGQNNYGQLGHGDQTLRNTPAQISGLSDVSQVYAGAYSSYAVTKSGNLYAWGRNHNGELGVNLSGDQLTPQIVPLIGELQDLSVGVSHVLAIIDSNLYSWGNDGFDQLGDGPGVSPLNVRDEPMLIDDSLTWKRVFAGGFHSHGWTSTNTIFAWGKNSHGQLGVGHTSPVSSSNTTTVSLGNLIQISGGYEHSLFLEEDGTVWASGSNLLGQTGNGSEGVEFPTLVPGLSLSGNNEISAGAYNSLYLQSSPFQIFIWGRNPSGNITTPSLYYSE